MQKPSRFLRLLGVAGLLATLLAATVVPVGAQPTPDPDPGQGATELEDPGLTLLQNSIYYPWVANDDDFGLGPADSSITVQNLEAIDTYIYIYKGTGAGWELYTTAYLAAWASKTFTATDLGIEAGAGVPVGVSAYHGGLCVTALGPGGTLDVGRDINGNETCSDVEVVVTLFDELPDPEQIDVCVANTASGATAPYWDASVGAYVTWDDVEDLEANYNAGGEFGGLNNDGDCSDAEGGATVQPTIIGGVAKTAAGGATLPYTTTEDTSVSGYNSINGYELDRFDQWYLPIVQTNCGPGGCWDTVIRAANYAIENSAITLRFFPADDGSGSLNTGFQLEFLINGGATENIVLSDYVPEGWVGSVHAYSDSAMMLMADRFKVGYNMWLTNTGSSADFENVAQVEGGLGQYVLFAPDVRVDYFGWNTGINVANLYEGDNNITVQYFNLFGNATGTQTQRLAAHGMTYFYDPSQLPQDDSSQIPSEDVNADVVGSALIWSDQPVAVAVDATKYPESTTELDENVFQGTTYSATANVYTWQSVPLVQKGNPADGMGATSGINMMNPNSVASQALVYWVNQSGFGADNFGTTGLAIPAFANGFVYTLAQHNLPNGFYGAALVTATYSIAATSANVDYQVQNDGSVIWNAFNPCGFYRTPGPEGECFFGDPFEQPGGGSVEKTFIDEFGAPVEGALAILLNDVAYQQLTDPEYPGIPWIGEGYSDVNGEVLWTNVPEGNYYLFADVATEWLLNEQDLPIFVDPGEEPQHEFQLNVGEDLSFTNELTYVRATKIVYAPAPGLEVCLFGEVDEEITEETVWGEDDLLLECGLADEDGDITFTEVPQGWYWVIVNAGIENPVDPAFELIVYPEDGPEFLEWGGTYENDIAGGVVGVGALTKNFYVGEYGPEGDSVDWTNIQFAVDIFCLDTVPGCVEEGANEVQSFDLGAPTMGSYTITIPDLPGGALGGTTADIAFDADAATIQAAVDAVVGAGQILVTVDGSVLTFEFVGPNEDQPVTGLVNVAAGVDFDGNVGDASIVVMGNTGLFASLGPADLFETAEDTYSFTLNSVPAGVYEICWIADLTAPEGLLGNEVQFFNTQVAGVDPSAGSFTLTIPALPSGFAGGTTGAIGFNADEATVQAAVDAVVPGEIDVAIASDEVTLAIESITFTYIGANAGLDVTGVFSVADAGLLPPYDGAVGDAVVTQEGGTELVEPVVVTWFGCEEVTVVADEEVVLDNSIDEDGVVVSDIIVAVEGTTDGATYETCLLYGVVLEAVFDCEAGVAGTGDTVFVTLSPDILTLLNAFLEDEAGFQLPDVFRARVRDEATDDITLSAITPVDVLVDLPPHIVVQAPQPAP